MLFYRRGNSTSSSLGNHRPRLAFSCPNNVFCSVVLHCLWSATRTLQRFCEGKQSSGCSGKGGRGLYSPLELCQGAYGRRTLNVSERGGLSRTADKSLPPQAMGDTCVPQQTDVSSNVPTQVCNRAMLPEHLRSEASFLALATFQI